MQVEQRSIKKHLFICTNQREQGECCSQKGSEELVTKIKMRLREADLWNDYKVTKSGCLGPCAKGISAVIYPDNLLVTEISLDDEDELYQLLTS